MPDLSKWTWMLCSEEKICAECEHMEGEGWNVVSIVQTSCNHPGYYKVFMRRALPETKSGLPEGRER